MESRDGARFGGAQGARLLTAVPSRTGTQAERDEEGRTRVLVGDLTLRLLDTPTDQLRVRIRETMETLARLLGFDRCGLARFSNEGRTLTWTEGFCMPDIPDLTGQDLAEGLPWYTEQLRQGHTHVFTDLPAEFPREAAAEGVRLAAMGVKSHLSIPLRTGGAVLGALGFTCVHAHRHWSPALLASLELLAGAAATVLRREASEQHLRRAEDLNHSLLVSLPTPAAVLDRHGRVTEASSEWTSSLRCEACPRNIRKGADYAKAWENAPAELQRAVPGAAEQVRAVLAGQRARFDSSISCSREGRDCNLHLTVAPLHGREGGALVLEADGVEVVRLKADLERSERRVRELEDRLDAGVVYLQKEVMRGHGFDEIVGTSALLGKILHQIEQVASADAPVLVLGETGTGKDLVARAVHERSRRKDKPLVAVNCAALPEALIESELFGYEKGAFTGAVSRTAGRFEVAHGGSILLDEIGELPLGVQAKLLRVLEGGTFERLGSAKTVHVNVRVLAATNRDLEREVREGRFRADLYYRLNVFPITIPPLRERREDVPLLVWHFVNARQGPLGRAITSVPERLMRALTAYSWPGNVRELENVVERALIVTQGSTLAFDASFLEESGDDAPAGSRLDDVQRQHILGVLRQCGWRVAGRGNAADRLGMKRATLQHRMKVLGIQRPTPDTLPM